MNDWVEFRHFRYLLEIMKHKGFRVASEKLHTAQPNLSAHAKQFRENSGVKLYTQGKDGRITLTASGIAFQSIAQGILDARDDGMTALKAIARGAIRIFKFGYSPYVDPQLFQSACELHKEMVPSCPIRPIHSDTVQLVEEILSGEIDAAILTLPVNEPALRVEELKRDRLVVCLRIDDPIAEKLSLNLTDIREKLAVFYEPNLHPQAHQRLLEMLRDAGIAIEDYSRVSHPSDLQQLVKQGYGYALIRQGTLLDPALTTRPIARVNWTVDTAIAYREQSHLETIPVLVRHLRKRLENGQQSNTVNEIPSRSVLTSVEHEWSPHSKNENSTQNVSRRYARKITR